MNRLPATARRIQCWLILGLLLFGFQMAQAQNRIITGHITNPAGEAISGVTVAEKNGKAVTTTDGRGNFSISVSSANPVLILTSVGFVSQEIPVSGNSVSVKLETDSKVMSDVVVIGYGSVRKSDLTGSVTSIKAKDLTPGANVSLDQALAGRAAGVQIYQKSGEPGASVSVKIRGISSITGGNDPLYVIDGMPVNNVVPTGATGELFPGNPNPRNPLNSLNPSDIESLEILKDASATAIYGSRGANGVVIITTKKGNPGRLKIDYNAYYGVQQVTRKLDLLTGTEYKSVLNQIIDDGGGVPSERVTNDAVNTDWQDLIFRKAMVTSHDLNISGGRENTRFYASLGYLNQEGVIRNSGVKRYSGRVNIETNVPSKYAFGMSLSSSYIHDNYPSVGLGINENGSGLYTALYYDPSYAAYDANGLPFRAPSMGTTMDHPGVLNDYQYAVSDNFRTFGNVFGEYFLTPSLSVKLRTGGDVNITQRNTWTGPETLRGLPFNGVGSINTGNANYYMGEATINYNKEFNKTNRLNAFVGATYDHYGSNGFGGIGAGYPLPYLTYNALGSGADSLERVSSGRASNKLISYLGRAIYSLNDKYLFTASVRADGSARFGPNNRYAIFPSAAFAWKLHEEDFLKNISAINELKFRTSFGSVGNQNIANYLYITSFSGSGSALFGSSQLYNTIAPTRPANPDLQWEGSRQFDAGIDFSLFGRRLNGTVDYFNRKAVDLLLALPLPLSSGFGTKTQNIGNMRNTGIEVSLNSDIVRSGDFTWNLSANFAAIKNRVLDLGPLSQIIQGGAGNLSSYEIIKPGQSIGSYYGYNVVGVWQKGDDFSQAPTNTKPGDLKFQDLDGNKLINAADRVILGKALPDFTYGFNSTMQFKGFGFTMFWTGQSGASNISNMLVDSYYPVSFRRNKLASVYLNRWTPSNPTNEYPGFLNAQFSASGAQGNQQINSKTVQDASYLRLQTATLSYRFNMSGVKAVKGLQIYVTGQNLLLFTDYIGYDPELNATGSDVTKIDYSSYPMSRTIMAGINVQF